MNEPKPDFSNKAYLFPHINPEGIKFGVIALVLAAAYTAWAFIAFERFFQVWWF